MDWETSKENFQPLKQGRDPGQIVKKAVQAPKTFDSQVEEQRRLFWKEIAHYEGPDPLEVWLRFIKWTQDTFESGGHRAEVLPLLERCTRELQDNAQYKDDVRYLRVWIQYADCLPEPRDVFTYLKEHNIGQDFCVYYVAYAAYLELRGSYAKAEGVFKAGLQRMAHPVDRLRSKYEDFQHRMARRQARKAIEGDEATAAEDENGLPARAVLNTLKAAKPRGPRARRAAGPSAAPQAAAGLSRSKRKGLFGAAPDSENRPSGGLEIFVDEAFRPGGASAAAIALPEATGTGDTGWKQLSTFEQTRKENVQQPGKWAGAKLKQKHSLVVEPAASLDIHVDEELAHQASRRRAKPDAEAAPSLRLRLDAPDLEEHLQHDPLRLHKGQMPAPDTSRAPPAAPRERAVAEGPVAKRKREERFAWDADKLVEPSGIELSFEEVRACDYLQQAQAAQLSGAQFPAEDAMEISSPVQSPGTAAPAQPDAHRTPSPEAAQQSPVAKHATLAGSSEAAERPFGAQPAVVERLKAVRTQLAAAAEARDVVRLGSANSSASPASDGSSQPRTQPSTPTSAAFGRSHSGSPLAAVQEEVPSDLAAAAAEQQPIQADALPDMTIATQAAFAAVNSMFAETMALPRRQLPSIASPTFADAEADQLGHVRTQASNGSGLQPSGRATAAAERGAADITIATRSAFDAVNSMFHGALPHDAPWPSTAADARPRRGGGRVSCGGALTAKLLTGRQPTASLRCSSQRHSMAPEPTVTMGTQAAFDALNSMFASQLPHEGVGKAAKQQRSVSQEEHSAVSAEQAEMDGLSLGASGMDFPIYEDTQFFGGKQHPGRNASGELGIYEDTQFMRPASPRASRPLAEHDDTDLAAAHAAAQQSPIGFQIYEDTVFMKENAAGKRGEALQLYEDTQFIGSAARQAAPSAGMQPAQHEAAPDRQHSPELGIYEETEFRTGSAQRGGSPQHTGAGSLEVYEDTGLLQGLRAGTDARAARHDVTALMTENVAPPARQQTAEDTGDLLADSALLDEHADQENQGPADRILPARDLADPAAAASVLKDLSAQRTAALDIEIEEDLEALQRLQLAGACEPDEFDVFHHDEHGLARTSIGDPESAASNNVANLSIAL